MTGVPKRGLSSLLGATWLALALLHGVLQELAPRSVLGDPLLPFWAKLCLFATEGALMGGALLGTAAVVRGLALVAPRRLSPGIPVLRCLIASTLLLILSVSWSMFWLSGQFLDGPGLRFAAGNFSSLFAYAAKVHPFLALGMPWLLVAGAVAASLLVPRGIERLRPEASFWTGAVAVGLFILAVLLAAAGELARRRSTLKITDPATGAVYSRGELYRLRRDRCAGPLSHWLARSLGTRDPLDAGEEDGPPVRQLSRPRISMEDYLSNVDQARVHRWNVLVVLVDSLRADQLRATGGAREVMPAVEALAREGTAFTDCVTPAAHTDYAAPAVFSSHYPLRSRDVYRYPKVIPYPRVMIYDVLKALGWRTALYSSQNEEWGQMLNYLQTGALDVCFHSKTLGVSEAQTQDRPAFAGSLDDAVTVSESLKWIDRGSGAPFFLYLNLQNSHLPYEVPDDFPRRFGPAKLDFKISIGWYPEEKTSVVKDVYADSLAYVDLQLQRLFEHLRMTGQWDRTLVVVTGDHGDAFYEHGTSAHANGVYDEAIRVPLVIRAPGMDGKRDGRPSGLLDIAPGVFHLLGLPPHPSFQGEDPFVPAFRGDRTRFVMSDTPWKTQLGVIRSGFKLIRDGETGGSLLYDLATDPGEKKDLTESQPEQARALMRRLSAWRRAQLEYYDNALRQSREYPPVLEED